MERQGRRHVTEEEFRALFAGGAPVRIAGMAAALGVDRSTVARLMRRHGTLTSINADAAWCILPERCRFDRLGFWETGGVRFFRDGNQLAAAVRAVEASEAGLELPAVSAAVGSRAAVQALGLVRAGRLRREAWDGRYVYFAADGAAAERQKAARQAAHSAAAGPAPVREESLAEALARESRETLELLVKVLLTCLRHPGFGPKSVALSLLRRGEKTCTAQVAGLLRRFGAGGKNS
jgi:hypothetical protein